MSAAPHTGEVGSQLTDFSPSRLGTISKCGRAFEYSYVHQLPQPYEKGNLLLGSAFHQGVQAWYELPDDGSARGFQTHDLAPLVCAQWERLLPPAVWRLIVELRELEVGAQEVAQAIVFKRPTIKSPTTTKEYLQAAAVKRFTEARLDMLAFCDLLPDVKWPKDEDPYKAYQKAAEWARAAQARWQPKPPPLVIEQQFSVEVFGFRVRGFIDAIRRDPAPDTGELIDATVDYKTGRQPLTPMEAFIQMYLYRRAREDMAEQWGVPVSDLVAIYHVRKDKYQLGRIDRARHDRLASQILHDRAFKIATSQFAPSYGYWCKGCDYRDLCERELDLWPGELGWSAELM